MALIEWYPQLRIVHVTCAAISVSLFTLRGTWMLAESAMLQRRWVRIAPHVIDTILLGSAIALAVTIRQYPFLNAWLTAKLLGLVTYIVLGTIALKRGRTRCIRAGALAAALVVFAYIVGAAVQHSPLSWLALR